MRVFRSWVCGGLLPTVMGCAAVAEFAYEDLASRERSACEKHMNMADRQACLQRVNTAIKQAEAQRKTKL